MKWALASKLLTIKCSNVLVDVILNFCLLYSYFLDIELEPSDSVFFESKIYDPSLVEEDPESSYMCQLPNHKYFE